MLVVDFVTVTMAEGEEQVQQVGEEEEDDGPSAAYKIPEKKSIDQLMEVDQEDESLKKYKATLLAKGAVEVCKYTFYCRSMLIPLPIRSPRQIPSIWIRSRMY